MKWHSFPSDPTEWARWINSLPNILPDGAMDNILVCVKDWPPKYETYKKKGHHTPVNPPSVFSVPSYFARQRIFSLQQKIESRKVDAASRQECAGKSHRKKFCKLGYREAL